MIHATGYPTPPHVHKIVHLQPHALRPSSSLTLSPHSLPPFPPTLPYPPPIPHTGTPTVNRVGASLCELQQTHAPAIGREHGVDEHNTVYDLVGRRIPRGDDKSDKLTPTTKKKTKQRQRQRPRTAGPSRRRGGASASPMPSPSGLAKSPYSPHPTSTRNSASKLASGGGAKSTSHDLIVTIAPWGGCKVAAGSVIRIIMNMAPHPATCTSLKQQSGPVPCWSMSLSLHKSGILAANMADIETLAMGLFALGSKPTTKRPRSDVAFRCTFSGRSRVVSAVAQWLEDARLCCSACFHQPHDQRICFLLPCGHVSTFRPKSGSAYAVPTRDFDFTGTPMEETQLLGEGIYGGGRGSHGGDTLRGGGGRSGERNGGVGAREDGEDYSDDSEDGSHHNPRDKNEPVSAEEYQRGYLERMKATREEPPASLTAMIDNSETIQRSTRSQGPLCSQRPQTAPAKRSPPSFTGNAVPSSSSSSSSPSSSSPSSYSSSSASSSTNAFLKVYRGPHGAGFSTASEILLRECFHAASQRPRAIARNTQGLMAASLDSKERAKKQRLIAEACVREAADLANEAASLLVESADLKERHILDMVEFDGASNEVAARARADLQLKNFLDSPTKSTSTAKSKRALKDDEKSAKELPVFIRTLQAASEKKKEASDMAVKVLAEQTKTGRLLAEVTDFAERSRVAEQETELHVPIEALVEELAAHRNLKELLVLPAGDGGGGHSVAAVAEAWATGTRLRVTTFMTTLLYGPVALAKDRVSQAEFNAIVMAQMQTISHMIPNCPTRTATCSMQIEYFELFPTHRAAVASEVATAALTVSDGVAEETAERAAIKTARLGRAAMSTPMSPKSPLTPMTPLTPLTPMTPRSSGDGSGGGGGCDNGDSGGVIPPNAETRLWKYAKSGDVRRFKHILERYPHFIHENSLTDGGTPMHAAVTGGHFLLTRFLLEVGADLDVHDILGRTPREVAVKMHSESTATTDRRHHEWRKIAGLLSVNVSLHRAARDGNAYRIRFLIEEEGGDPNSRNVHGMRPLHLAVARGQLDIVQVLLDAGADVCPTNKCGETPEDLARRHARRVRVEMEDRCGSDVDPVIASAFRCVRLIVDFQIVVSAS